MPKNNHLDEVNKKIISILMENARISLSDLSKKIGISRGMIANRLANLEKSGVIKKYTAVVTEEYFRKPLPAFFNIKVDPKYIFEAAEKISTYEDIVVVYQMSGNSALHVHGYFEDIKAVYAFVSEKLNTLSGIQDISIEFLLKKFKSDLV